MIEPKAYNAFLLHRAIPIAVLVASLIFGFSTSVLAQEAAAAADDKSLVAGQGGPQSIADQLATAESVRALRAALNQRFAEADVDAVAGLSRALENLEADLSTPPREFPVADLPGLPVSVARALEVVELRRLVTAERDVLSDSLSRLSPLEMPASATTVGATREAVRAAARANEINRVRKELEQAKQAQARYSTFLEAAALQLQPSDAEREAWTEMLSKPGPQLEPDSWAGIQGVKELSDTATALHQRLQYAVASVAMRLADNQLLPAASAQTMAEVDAETAALERAYSRADRRLTLIAGGSDRRAQEKLERSLSALRQTMRDVDQSASAFSWLVAAEAQRWTRDTPFLSRRFADLGSAWTSLREGTVFALTYPMFVIGEAPITLGGTLRVILILVAALFASRWLRRGLDRYGQRRPDVSRPALYAAGRVLHYAMIAIGFGVALAAIGLDLTKIAIFASALGVGIGFGLQTVVNNFISGLILLFERSLKIGDFVELESGVTGEVTDISIRATRVTTNDNIDILVPNSEFVNGRVTSWTLREITRRVRIKFGVAYGTDKELVKKAALEAAAGVPFTIAMDGPRRAQVWLVNFGDSSLDFELVVWLTADAVKRPAAVQAAYYWALEDALRAYGIEIPFPQRDLHVRSLFTAQGDAAQALWRGVDRDHENAPKGSNLSDRERRQLGGNDALDDALRDLPKSGD